MREGHEQRDWRRVFSHASNYQNDPINTYSYQRLEECLIATNIDDNIESSPAWCKTPSLFAPNCRGLSDS